MKLTEGVPTPDVDFARLRNRLRQHVRALAEEIGERNVWRAEALDRAAAYLETSLRTFGYSVSRQEYRARGELVRNLEATLTGTRNPSSLIVSAHYDSAIGCPGANDNATGIAAMLEIATACAGRSFASTLRFVAFVNEEPPFFQTDDMGSLVYARSLSERQQPVSGMLSLETIGCYSTVRGSQAYPFPLGPLYRSTGDFIAFVTNRKSRSFLQRLTAVFQQQTTLPFQAAALPAFVPGVAWSDHWAFWQQGFPGVMITDTGPFRYPHYHSSNDTPDKIDYETLTQLVAALSRTVLALAAAGEPTIQGSR